MNILMLGRWLPPPRRAVRAMREYQFAGQLKNAHRLTLAFMADNPDSAGPISALRSEFGDLEFAVIPRGWKSLSSALRLATGESCTLSYFRSEALRTRLADRLRRTRYDLIFVSSSTMIQYALEVDPAIPIVMDFGSVGSEWWLQQAERGAFPGTRFFRTEAARLRAAEAQVAQRAVLLLTETSEAARIVESLAPGGKPTVVPSGVDVESFPSHPPTGKVPTVIFSTSLAAEAEVKDAVEFCESVVPAVRARVPQARFVVASKDPIPNPAVAGRLRGVELLPSTDLRLLFHDHAVAVAPLDAGFDVRGSALEAMAAGVPVVATRRVREHLGAAADVELRVGDDPAEFARHVIELLVSNSEREAVGANGRRFVRANFSWEVFGARLESLLTGAVKRRLPASGGPESRPIPAAFGG
jgi:glycosyltransferase involved in cell wall biosynthesis